MRYGWLIGFLWAGCLIGSPLAASGAAYQAVRESAEYLSQKLVREGTEAAAESGSRAELRRLAQEVGEDVIPLKERLGPDVVPVVRRFGRPGMKVLEEHGDSGLALLARSGDTVMPLVGRYGDDVVTVSLKHPGVGLDLVSRYGDEGLRVGKQLNTEDVIRFLKMAPRYKDQKTLNGFVQLVSRSGGKVFRFLEKHPKTVLGGGTIAYLLSHPQALENAGSSLSGGLLKGAGFSPESRPLWSLALVFGLVGVVVGPIYLYCLLRGRRRR